MHNDYEEQAIMSLFESIGRVYVFIRTRRQTNVQIRNNKASFVLPHADFVYPSCIGVLSMQEAYAAVCSMHRLASVTVQNL